MMNQKALDLGLKNTAFKTPHGLDKEGHYTTAYELALLSNYALSNETFRKIVGTKSATITINGSSRNISNTNELLGNLNGVYGIKTGFTNGANRCLVSACKRDNLDIICVVLGADTKKFRTTDSIKLIEYCFANFSPINVQEIAIDYFNDWKSKNKDTFSVYKPSSSFDGVELTLENDATIPYAYSDNSTNGLNIPIKNSEIDNLKVDITCDKNLIAPITKNTILGELNVSSDGNVIYSSKILLANNIDKKNLLQYFIQLLKSF